MKKNRITPGAEEAPDPVKGTNGDDVFVGDGYGKPQVDIFYGRGGHDLAYGGSRGDRLHGGKGSDSLYGELGNDVVFGDAGDDRLDGGSHDDTLTGGSGADVFFFRAWGNYSGSSGVDRITDFDPGIRGEFISLSVIPDFGVATFDELKALMIQDGDNVNLSFEGLDILVLEDVEIGELRADDFLIYLA